MDDNTSRLMNHVAKNVDTMFNGTKRPGDNGFVILVFPRSAEPGQRVNYVSNCERGEMTRALQEVVERFTNGDL